MDRILLGAAQPGQVVAVYEDALKRLLDRLQYLFPGNNRYWFDTRPNLRREMESRKTRFEGRDQIIPCLREFVGTELRGSSSFSGVHVFTPSADIPDDLSSGPRLVVLEPESSSAYSKGNASAVYEFALKMLEQRGDQPRQRRNRLLFLACDYDSMGRLKDNAKTFLAWKSIADDIEDDKLNLDMHNKKQAEQAFEQSKKVLSQSIKDAYKWLLNPFEGILVGKPSMKWEVTAVSTGGSNFIATIENKLREEEWVIYEWSPIHLSNELKKWFFREGQTDVVTRKLLNDFASFLYLPRLASELVLKNAIAQGIIADEFFGYAQGRSGDRYLGLTIGAPTQVIVDESSMLVDREAAIRQRDSERHEAALRVTQAGTPMPVPGSAVVGRLATGLGSSLPGQPGVSSAKKTFFFATKELNARTPKVDFTDMIEKVWLQLSSRSSTSVSVSVEINANDADGFEADFIQEITKVCQAQGFKQSDFT
ncbi:MAG: hypothetical protein EOP09_02640 [Proteobacteria bacterium]|nr:MAG: hypothetical protein EOP09_02640 [Pseudomonadota bacterium]